MGAIVLMTTFALAADPAEYGRFPVGVETRSIDEPNYRHALRTEIWYPAKRTDAKPEGSYPNGIPSRAVREAPVADGRFPIVLFSHGLAGVREQSTFLTEHLASHGFIVLSCDHPFNTGRDLSPLRITDSLRERPTQVRTLLDRLWRANGEAGDRFCGRCDLSRVAAAGHSMGGYTSLVLGGAPARLPAPPGSRAEFLELRCGDPRIGAVVALAPATSPFFSAESLAEVHVPVLILAGSLDEVTPVRINQTRAFEALRGPKYLGVVEGATHFNFNDEEMLLTAPWVVRAQHRPKIPRQEADATVRGLTLAFLDRYLRSGSEYQAVLEHGRDRVVWRMSPGGAAATAAAPAEKGVEVSRR